MTERQTPELKAGERLPSPTADAGDAWRGLPISVVLHAALIVAVVWTAVAPSFPALDESGGIIFIEVAEEKPSSPGPPSQPDPPAAPRDNSANESAVAKASEPPGKPTSPPDEVPLASARPQDSPPSTSPTGTAPAPQPATSAEEMAGTRAVIQGDWFA